MSKALYRKYRSKRLDEIVGQRHITGILSSALAKGRIAHAYLLTGPRGVGKTSIARILAHEINQLPYEDETTHLDIIEIDAASNNGVEDVRDLRQKVHIAPVSASKKVYIIDEVHMLSKAAFNALLKTLEEPPEHVVFILATTDADKLPATIVSRTQQFNFRAISPKDAVEHLKVIAKAENITIDDEALRLIASRGEGSFRDSISLLDQLRSLADDKTGITRQLAETALGLAPHELIDKLLQAYEARNLNDIVQLLDDSEAAGTQALLLTSQLIDAVRSKLIEKPHFINLLDSLLDVAKSSRPDIKLLTTLAPHFEPRTKAAALQSSSPAISAPIAELSKQATKPKPSITRPSSATTHQRNAPIATPTAATANETPGVVPKVAGELDWNKLIEHTRQHYVAIYSVLSKCDYDNDDDTLVIYTNNAFYKKKLDDSKHRLNLTKALTETGAGDIIIETIGSSAPPKDSQAAAVAAIMGGGKEVSIE